MGNSIISKGKSVTEALSLGLDLLDSSKDEVDIEIIDYGKKQFFGLSVKPAVVKITKRNVKSNLEESHSEDQFLESFSEVMDQEELPPNPINDRKRSGKVWVENGQIHFIQEGDKYPTLASPSYGTLIKNGKTVKETTFLSDDDEIQIELPQEKSETKWEIKINSNKTRALLTIDPGRIKTYILEDADPAEHLKLNVRELIEIDRSSLNTQAIVERLNELNVSAGIVYAEISKAIEAEEKGDFVVAAAKMPEQGTNGWVEVKVSLKEENEPRVREDGTIDFREIKSIPTVEKGDLIAVVHDPVPGVNGLTITGETIPALPVHPVVVKTDKGIELSEDGTIIVATQSGRPYVEEKGQLVKVKILPRMVHQGDVDLSTGNIRFYGDIDITGNVLDNMVVEADGQIVIRGMTSFSTASAGESITIKRNVIGSKILAGNQEMMRYKLKRQVKELNHNLQKVIRSIEQITCSPAFKKTDFAAKGLSSLVRLLLEKKFEFVKIQVQSVVKLIMENDDTLEEDWADLAKKLREGFLLLHPNTFQEIDELKQFVETSMLLENSIEKSQFSESFVKLPYALKSEISSSGDVTITGQGCYNSQIYAGNEIKVNGLVRGGELYAENSIQVKEAGSQSGSQTTLAVSEHGFIEVSHALENTVIQVGSKKYTLPIALKNIKANIDSNGELQVREKVMDCLNIV